MKFILKLGLILAALGVIAAGGLALLNDKTAPIIAELKAQKQAEARQAVARPLGAEFFAPVQAEELTYYRAYGPDSSLVGYVGLALGKGYSSTIETVAGFSTEFEVSGLKVTFQQETPGLGDKVQQVKRGEKEPWWLEQFKGVKALSMAVKQDRGQIDAVTGATITSRAITNSVRELARQIQQAETEAEQAAIIDQAAQDTTGTESAMQAANGSEEAR